MGERGNSVLFTKKRLFTRLITVKNPDDLAKIQFLTKNTDIIFTHEICGLDDTLFSLNIGMLTEGGRAHPVNEKINWLKGAGVSDIRYFRVEAMPTGVITGIKA